MDKFFKFLLVSVMLVTVLVFATSCGFHKWVGNTLNPQYATIEIRYVMRTGDTVWNVAENYFLEQDKIKNLNEFIFMVRHRNGLTQSKRIVQVGDVIYIPLSRKIPK